jgi:hypothetical protein
MHWFFLSYFCMLQVIEAYLPTNHDVMTSLLAGARVHRLDCAHGSIELASPSRAHGGWSEVWLPACQQGGATNRAWQRWHDPVGAVVHHFCKEHLWGVDDVVRRSLPGTTCPHEHSLENKQAQMHRRLSILLCRFLYISTRYTFEFMPSCLGAK